MQHFMCEFSIHMPSSDIEFLESLIAEKNYSKTLERSSVFQQIWLKNDKSGGYSILEAQNLKEAHEKLYTLPLYRFMNFNIQPLLT